jgi:hypothetical protein
MAKEGRPTKYDERFHPKLVYCLAVRGLTDDKIAEELDIAKSTLYEWEATYPEFSDSKRKGKEEPDQAVENSLFKKATGYSYKTQKPLVVLGPAGSGSSVEIVDYTETIPPSDTAMIFWLKNRRPDRWRDKQELEHSGGIGVTIVDDIK